MTKKELEKKFEESNCWFPGVTNIDYYEWAIEYLLKQINKLNKYLRNK